MSKKLTNFTTRYRPIEINNSIPLKKKSEKMNEWWEKHFVLIAIVRIKFKFN
jgi:hypothetical protein